MKRGRKLIVFDGNAWFVRRVVMVRYNLDLDEKVYHCDKPLSGPHTSLADVPEVRRVLSRKKAK